MKKNIIILILSIITSCMNKVKKQKVNMQNFTKVHTEQQVDSIAYYIYEFESQNSVFYKYDLCLSGEKKLTPQQVLEKYLQGNNIDHPYRYKDSSRISRISSFDEDSNLIGYDISESKKVQYFYIDQILEEKGLHGSLINPDGPLVNLEIDFPFGIKN